MPRSAGQVLPNVVTALGQTTWPEVRVLGVILGISGVLFLVAAGALTVVAFCPSVLTSAMPGAPK